MDDLEYKTTLDRMILIGRFAAELELEPFIERAALTATIGPILAPSAYMAGGERVAATTQLARRLRAFQVAFAEPEARAILGLPGER